MAEVEERILNDIVGVDVCTSRVLKLKEHPQFCSEFSMFSIEDRVSVDLVV